MAAMNTGPCMEAASRMHRRENLSGDTAMPTVHAKMMCGDTDPLVRDAGGTTQASSAIRKHPTWLTERINGRTNPVTRRAFRGEPMEQWDRLLVGADTGVNKSQVKAVCDRLQRNIKARGLASVGNAVIPGFNPVVTDARLLKQV